jgi:uncharacterized membrane protein
MTKQEFLSALRKRLSNLPKQETEERLAFYSEIIDDRIEEGSTEKDAVQSLGTVEEIASQIIADIPLTKIVKERIRPKRRLNAPEIVLLVLGSPIWLSLGVAAFAVLLSVYAVLWSVVISLWAVFASLAACGLGGVVAGVGFAIGGYAISGIALLGAGIVCAGLAILLFFGCTAAVKGTALLTKAIALGVKKCFVKREEI